MRILQLITSSLKKASRWMRSKVGFSDNQLKELKNRAPAISENTKSINKSLPLEQQKIENIYQAQQSLPNLNINQTKATDYIEKPKLIKKLDGIEEYQFKNGLKVLLKPSENKKGALKEQALAGQLILKTGADADPSGKKGLAHFLEHRICENAGEFRDRALEHLSLFLGGHFGAYTTYDHTNYYFELPPSSTIIDDDTNQKINIDNTEVICRMLTAILREVDVGSENDIEIEKGIVKDELKRGEADTRKKTYFKFNELLWGKNHPRKFPVIGTMQDVENTTKKDLEDFYNTYYRPNNASLVFSGNFDKDRLLNIISAYFSKYKAQELVHAENLNNLTQAEQKEPKSKTISDPGLRRMLKIAFPVPEFKNQDSKVLHLISQALFSGVNGRLHKRLVEDEQIALAIQGYQEPSRHKDYYRITAIPKDGQSSQVLDVLDKAISEELNKIKENGLTEDEFTRIIAENEAEETYKLDNTKGQGFAIGFYEVLGDWSKYPNYIKDLKKISNDDIKRVAHKYFAENKKSTLKVLPGKKQPGIYDEQNINQSQPPQTAEKKNPSVKELRQLAKPKLAEALLSHANDINIKDVFKLNLKSKNALLFYKNDPSVPLSFFKLSKLGGSHNDPKDKPGLNYMTMMLFNEVGTKTSEKFKLEESLSRLGASISFYSGAEQSGFNVTTLSKNTNEVFSILNDYIQNTALLEMKDPQIIKRCELELDKLKKQFIEGIVESQKYPSSIAHEKFMQAIYPKGHFFYELAADEEIKLIKSITLDDIRKSYQANFNINNSKLTALGDVNPDQVKQFLDISGTWNPRPLKQETLMPIDKVNSKKEDITIHKEEKPQSSIIIGNDCGISKDDPQYYAALLANHIFSALRLFKTILLDEGLVYGIGSNFTPMLAGGGPFKISTSCSPEKVKKVTELITREIKKIMENGITQDELDQAKAFYMRGQSQGFTNRQRICNTLNHYQIRGKDENYIHEVIKKIDSVSLDDVNQALKLLIKPDKLTTVVVGPKPQANIIKLPEKEKLAKVA